MQNGTACDLLECAGRLAQCFGELTRLGQHVRCAALPGHSGYVTGKQHACSGRHRVYLQIGKGSRMSRDAIEITPSVTAHELLEAYPELEDVLIGIAPPFKKLKNPLLRKSVAKMATGLPIVLRRP